MNIGFILVMVMLLATALVLFAGMFAMAKGGEFNKKYGNKLMQLRVACQAVAIVLVAILLMMKD